MVLGLNPDPLILSSLLGSLIPSKWVARPTSTWASRPHCFKARQFSPLEKLFEGENDCLRHIFIHTSSNPRYCPIRSMENSLGTVWNSLRKLLNARLRHRSKITWHFHALFSRRPCRRVETRFIKMGKKEGKRAQRILLAGRIWGLFS